MSNRVTKYTSSGGTGVTSFNTRTGSVTLISSDITTALGFTPGEVASVSGTSNRITSTGGAMPVIDISSTFEALLGKVASPLSQFASTTSSELAGIISDETGTGALVFANAPTLIGASIGSSTATTQTASDNSTKVATTAFVMQAILGQNFKEACKYGTIAALPSIVYTNGSSGVGATITGVSFGALNIDSSSPSVNDRILIKNQVSTFQNGIYIVTAVGSVAAVFVLTRAADFNQTTEIFTGDSAFITSGNTLGTTTWAYNGGDNPVMGTDPITFAQTAGQGSFTQGNGITITGMQIAVDLSVVIDHTTTQTLTGKTLTDAVNSVSTPTTTSVGYLGIPQNSQSTGYTLVLTDAGKSLYHPSADTTARTWTIPANASVAFPIGTTVTFINDTSGGTITIAITTDTLVFIGAGSTGSRTLAANGMATATKVTSTRWVINGTNLT